MLIYTTSLKFIALQLMIHQIRVFASEPKEGRKSNSGPRLMIEQVVSIPIEPILLNPFIFASAE